MGQTREDRFHDRLYLKLRVDSPCSRIDELLPEEGKGPELLSCNDPLRLEAPSLEGIRELHFGKEVDGDFVKSLEEEEDVVYAEKVPRHHFSYTPNDLQPGQWSLPRISAESAWDLEKGVDSIDIAVIDNAFRITHEDLLSELDTNTDEIAGNGVDDDGNGYVDDVHGWDAADNDNDPTPPPSASNSNFTHGTHVAGIAAGATDNGVGMASIGFGVDYIPVKIAEDATGSLTGGLQGIEYAIAIEADIMNMSWGGRAIPTPIRT